MGEFEKGFSDEGNTREHALLAQTMAVKRMVIAVNKMDADSVNYSKDRFKEIKTQVTAFLKKMAYNYKKISFIPISGFEGENLTQPSDKMPWYDGPTLMRALENLRPVTQLENLPLRVPVRDVYRIGGVGTVPVGRVETGILKKG